MRNKALLFIAAAAIAGLFFLLRNQNDQRIVDSAGGEEQAELNESFSDSSKGKTGAAPSMTRGARNVPRLQSDSYRLSSRERRPDESDLGYKNRLVARDLLDETTQDLSAAQRVWLWERLALATKAVLDVRSSCSFVETPSLGCANKATSAVVDEVMTDIEKKFGEDTPPDLDSFVVTIATMLPALDLFEVNGELPFADEYLVNR